MLLTGLFCYKRYLFSRCVILSTSSPQTVNLDAFSFAVLVFSTAVYMAVMADMCVLDKYFSQTASPILLDISNY